VARCVGEKIALNLTQTIIGQNVCVTLPCKRVAQKCALPLLFAKSCTDYTTAQKAKYWPDLVTLNIMCVIKLIARQA
jgi:hypothetical protein